MKRQKWLTGIVVMMLVASFLVAVGSFVVPFAQAAPTQPGSITVVTIPTLQRAVDARALVAGGGANVTTGLIATRSWAIRWPGYPFCPPWNSPGHHW